MSSVERLLLFKDVPLNQKGTIAMDFVQQYRPAGSQWNIIFIITPFRLSSCYKLNHKVINLYIVATFSFD